MIFKNRQIAGEKLAEKMSFLSIKDPIILGIPRGGVVVASEVSKRLQARLDVVVSKKISAPGQPELAVGAVSENNILVLNKKIINHIKVSAKMLDLMVEKEKSNIEKSIKLFRNGKNLKNLNGTTAVIIDDGLATGMTAIAAIRAVKKLHPAKIIFATPICALNSVENVIKEIDEMTCLEKSDHFVAICQRYQNFSQVSDEEVMSLI